MLASHFPRPPKEIAVRGRIRYYIKRGGPLEPKASLSLVRHSSSGGKAALTPSTSTVAPVRVPGREWSLPTPLTAPGEAQPFRTPTCLAQVFPQIQADMNKGLKLNKTKEVKIEGNRRNKEKKDCTVC